MAGSAALACGLVWRPRGVPAVSGFVLDSALFAGDPTWRAFSGRRLRRRAEAPA
jgi:hypothetical protein